MIALQASLTRLTVLLLLSAVVAVGAISYGGATTTQAAGAHLIFPSTTCNDNSAKVTFTWQTLEGASEQSLDYSLEDNTFEPDTFQSLVLEADQVTIVTRIDQTDSPIYWRINSNTPDGWVSSNVSAFMPCGQPQLLWGPVICQSATRASVDFRWAPRADAFGFQWLELSQDVKFTTGVTQVGPMGASAESKRHSGFRVGERTYFRIVWEDIDGNRVVSDKASFKPDCSVDAIRTALYASADRITIPRLGIDAPVNVRDVGFDGFLGVPGGASDVVRYNFAAWPSLRGYPGQGGVTLIGGHVDFYSVGAAVFAPLRSAQIGDVIEYRLADGTTLSYKVDWISDFSFDRNILSILRNSGEDELILVTCNGSFDASVGRYDLRRFVHAVPTN